MSFEFMYSGEYYKYENGWLYQQRGSDFYIPFCPVLIDLNNKLQDFSAAQLLIIMKAILHGYFHGEATGQKHKIQEFKRVFALD